MSAPDIEGLTDQIVEYAPGERDLAERIARGIWPYIERRERFAIHEFHKEPSEFTFVRLTDQADEGDNA